MVFQDNRTPVQLELINQTLRSLLETSGIEIANIIGTLCLAAISIYIAVKSLKQTHYLEEKRMKEKQEATDNYFNTVEVILDKIVNEIEEIITIQKNSLTDKSSEEKLIYINKSISYTVQQVKSRLYIVCSFEFSTMDSKRLNDLYEVRTLVAGIFNALYGYKNNLKNGSFLLEYYERYLNDTLEDINDIKTNNLSLEI